MKLTDLISLFASNSTPVILEVSPVVYQILIFPDTLTGPGKRVGLLIDQTFFHIQGDLGDLGLARGDVVIFGDLMTIFWLGSILPLLINQAPAGCAKLA